MKTNYLTIIELNGDTDYVCLSYFNGIEISEFVQENYGSSATCRLSTEQEIEQHIYSAHETYEAWFSEERKKPQPQIVYGPDAQRSEDYYHSKL